MPDKNIQININAKDNASAPIKEVEKSARGLTSGLHAMGQSVGNSFASVARTIWSFKTYIITALTAIGVYSNKTSGDFEQWNIAFETMLGSKEKAVALMQDLVQFSKATPFNTKEVVEYSKQLLAMGIGAEDIVRTMTNLGNIAAGVGRDKFPQLTLAFGQVRAAGHLTGMELRQFTEAGVPLLDELAKKFNVSTSQIQKMVSAGVIGFSDVDIALQNLTNGTGKFANLMEKQSKSFLGVLSNLKDQADLIAKSIGDGFVDVFRSSFQNLQKSLTGIDLEGVRYGIASFFLSVKTQVLVLSEIIKTAITSPFKFETYKGIFLQLLQSIHDLAEAVAGGLKAIQAYRKKLQAEEERDGRTLTERLINIHAKGIQEQTRLESEHNARITENKKKHVSLAGDVAKKIVQINEEESKSTKIVAKEKGDSIKELAQKEIDALEDVLRYDDLTTDQKIKNIQNFLNAHKIGINITAEQEKKLSNEIQELQKSKAIKQQEF